MGLYTHLCLKVSEQGIDSEAGIVASRERKYGCPLRSAIQLKKSH